MPLAETKGKDFALRRADRADTAVRASGSPCSITSRCNAMGSAGLGSSPTLGTHARALWEVRGARRSHAGCPHQPPAQAALGCAQAEVSLGSCDCRTNRASTAPRTKGGTEQSTWVGTKSADCADGAFPALKKAGVSAVGEVSAQPFLVPVCLMFF